MGSGPGRSLSRREFDAVIRRAAELAAADPEAGEGDLTEAELYRIAGEVGLTKRHVREALADVRTGHGAGTLIDRVFGPSSIRASRAVPGTPEELAPKIDEFLVASQLLQPLRRGTNVLQYRPAVDWASQLARAASFSSRKYYIASARSVEVHLDPLEDVITLVEILVDPGTRGDHVVGAALGGGGGGGGGGALVAWGLAAAMPVSVAVTFGAVVGASIWGGITYGVGQSHKRKLAEVHAELEGVLDALEAGRSLEPPPPSWRRWVKRHFHGVARDFMRNDAETDL